MTKHIGLGAGGFFLFPLFLGFIYFWFLWEGKEVERRLEA